MCFGSLDMENNRKETLVQSEEQVSSDVKSAILVVPVMTVLNVATGETESLWVWQPED
jgi:hypothetical protein